MSDDTNKAREMPRPETGIQDSLEQLYAELGKALVLRRSYCKETSLHPPGAAQVTEIAKSIALLGKVWRP